VIDGWRVRYTFDAQKKFVNGVWLGTSSKGTGELIISFMHETAQGIERKDRQTDSSAQLPGEEFI
jgi:hypothetical protein